LLAGMARKEHPDYVQYDQCTLGANPRLQMEKMPTTRVTPHSPDLGIAPADLGIAPVPWSLRG
jgi:hypothetical protein